MSGEHATTTGLTLVELMVSLLLGSVLSLAISKVYLEGIRNFVVQEEMARIQDNGRLSLSLLNRELQIAGFYGGTPSEALPSTAVSTDCIGFGNWALDIIVPIDVISDFKGAGPGSMRTANGVDFTCLPGEEIAPGTDVLSIKRTAGNYTVKQGAYQGDSIAKTNQWYMRLEDFGNNRGWFYHRSGGFPSEDISPDGNVDYWEYYARIFYIRKYSEVVTDGIPTLCVESLGGGSTLGTMASQCLVEGVEELQIEFGIDDDFDTTPNWFTGTPTGGEMANAVVARIYLLMRSVAEVPQYKRARSYQLGSKKVEREDGYVRRVMSSTVQMPNLSLALG